MSKRRLSSTKYKSDPWFRQLCRAMILCKNEREVADFLRDVATLSELQAMGERLEIAKLISKETTYREITASTGASTTTVTRVANFLRDGTGGYKRALSHIKHSSHSRKEKSVISRKK